MTDTDKALAALREAFRFEILTEMGMAIRNEGGPDNDQPTWVFVDHQPCAEVTSYDYVRSLWDVDGPWKTIGAGAGTGEPF